MVVSALSREFIEDETQDPSVREDSWPTLLHPFNKPCPCYLCGRSLKKAFWSTISPTDRPTLPPKFCWFNSDLPGLREQTYTFEYKFTTFVWQSSTRQNVDLSLTMMVGSSSIYPLEIGMAAGVCWCKSEMYTSISIQALTDIVSVFSLQVPLRYLKDKRQNTGWHGHNDSQRMDWIKEKPMSPEVGYIYFTLLYYIYCWILLVVC